MLGHHDVAMMGQRQSQQSGKQLAVVSILMFGFALHSAMDAGIFAPLTIVRGTFPPRGAGRSNNNHEFVYKSMIRDYAAVDGTMRTVASDLDMIGPNEEILDANDVDGDGGDLLYAIFLDDVTMVPGGKTRFVGGALFSSANRKQNASRKKMLLDANERIASGETTRDVGSTITSKHVMYEFGGKFPNVDVGMAYHPHSGGIWSSLVQSYKIIPKFMKYARENGESGKSPIVIATCSAKQRMCTYYTPLAKRDMFFMGKKTTEEYAKEFVHAGILERMGIRFDGTWGRYCSNIYRGMKRAVGLGGKMDGKSEL